METNIIIAYDNGKYTEIRKVFDADKQPLLDGLGHYVTFLFDTGKYTKEQVVSKYLTDNNLQSVISFDMRPASSVIENSKGITLKQLIDAFIGLFKLRFDGFSRKLFWNLITKKLATQSCEEILLPDNFKFIGGCKELCTSTEPVRFNVDLERDIYIKIY